MLSAQTLAMIRRITGDFLTQTCTIEREAPTRGSYGEPTHDWEVQSTGTACRVIKAGQFNTAANELVGSQETLPDTYKLVVARSTTLDVDYRVTVDSEVFYVTRLETDLADEAFHAALISRQRGDGNG